MNDIEKGVDPLNLSESMNSQVDATSKHCQERFDEIKAWLKGGLGKVFSRDTLDTILEGLGATIGPDLDDHPWVAQEEKEKMRKMINEKEIGDALKKLGDKK